MTTDDMVAKEVAEARTSNYPISSQILNRWSPRAMTGEPLGDDELFALFEAARWAPSSGNGQPWRFVVARRQDEEKFTKMFDLLAEGNQAWCDKASALVIVLSNTMTGWKGAFERTHAFCTGMATENLAIEGAHRGLVVHGIGGFDYDRAKSEFGVPDDHEVMAMYVIGKRASVESLPEKYQEREIPSDRMPLSEVVYDGAFGTAYDQLK
ncbi:nitroreductase family protein [Patescibacteria group bacterium]